MRLHCIVVSLRKKFHSFVAIGEKELSKHIKSSKSTYCIFFSKGTFNLSKVTVKQFIILIYHL